MVCADSGTLKRLDPNCLTEGAVLMNEDPREQEQSQDHFVKHGGVHFRTHVEPAEINNFIRKLPAGKRESLFEVLEQLDQAGMISIVNDHVFTDGDGIVGGGDSQSLK